MVEGSTSVEIHPATNETVAQVVVSSCNNTAIKAFEIEVDGASLLNFEHLTSNLVVLVTAICFRFGLELLVAELIVYVLNSSSSSKTFNGTAFQSHIILFNILIGRRFSVSAERIGFNGIGILSHSHPHGRSGGFQVG